MPNLLSIFAAAGLSLAVAGSAHAAGDKAASDWFITEQAEVRLISATEAVGSSTELKLGLQIKLKPGWKVYWRTPGDAGFPPRLNWAGSENLAKAEMGWPAPTRFVVLGFQTAGYKKEVVYPITVTLNDAGKAARFRANVNFLTCDDICIPYTADLSLDLPAGGGGPSDFFQKINQFTTKIPGDGTAVGLKLEKAEIAGSLGPVQNGFRDGFIRVVVKSQVRFNAPDVFVEGPPEAVFSQPEVSLSDGGKTAVLRVPVSVDEEFEIAGLNFRFTIVDGARSAEGELALGIGPPASAVGAGTLFTLPVMLAMALLGGLILNLMPCVLPVLSLKMLSVVKHGGGDKREVRVNFIASSAGILFSFLVLASGLVILKAAGATIGWGIQFQQPWFLVTMILLVSLFAYNMWGVFEVQLPSRLSGIIGKPRESSGIAGNFGTGAFATLLATPCSAPFLGTAVGFALSRGTFDTYAIFTALGIGMSAPFLLVAAVPSLATKLPKPGAWMNRVKQVMGVALAATALWLISVLAVQVSLTAAGVVGAIMVVLGVVLLGRRILVESRRWISAAAIALLVVGSYLTPGQFAQSSLLGGRETVSQDHWQPFDEAAIAGLVAQGKTVFVDVTAEWCITCQVNKLVVLNRGEVFALLSSDDFVAMKADWTRPSKIISAYLAKFGKFGIPFNIVYGPAAPAGVVLPELLRKGVVMAAFQKAGSTTIVKN